MQTSPRQILAALGAGVALTACGGFVVAPPGVTDTDGTVDDTGGSGGGGGDDTGGSGGGGSDTGGSGGGGDDTGGNGGGGGPPTGPNGELILSEVGDGGTFGWVELFNASTATLDLGEYRVSVFENNQQSAVLRLDLPDVDLPSGQTFVIASSTSAFTSAFGFGPNFESDIIQTGGNDPVVLGEGAGFDDAFGRNATGPATGAWEHPGEARVRVSGIRQGSTTYSASQWRLDADGTPGQR